MDTAGNGHDIDIVSSNNDFANCYVAEYGAAYYPSTDGDTSIQDTGSTYAQMAVTEDGGVHFCERCTYTPVNLIFNNCLADKGGNVYISTLVSPNIHFDSWKTTNTYSENNGGSIYIYDNNDQASVL